MHRVCLGGLAALLASGIAAPAVAAPSAIFPGQAWTRFCFGAAGSEAADCGSGDALNPFFTIAGGTTTTIEVTDAFLPGDIFRIELNNGSEVFFSSAADLAAPFEADPDAAFLGGRFSRAAITLDPGFNSFRIFADTSPFLAGGAFVRVVLEPTIGVPAPAAFTLFGLALAGLLAARRR